MVSGRGSHHLNSAKELPIVIVKQSDQFLSDAKTQTILIKMVPYDTVVRLAKINEEPVKVHM